MMVTTVMVIMTFVIINYDNHDRQDRDSNDTDMEWQNWSYNDLKQHNDRQLLQSPWPYKEGVITKAIL